MTDALWTPTARQRAVVYGATTVALMLGFVAFRDAQWRGGIHLHTVMEVMATLLASAVGAMALMRYYSRKDNTFLFIGTGFLGTALLDAYHTVVTSAFFQPLMPSDLPSLSPWSWIASRQFLSVMLFLSFLAWLREEYVGPSGRVRERTVYVFSALFTVLCFLFFAFVPLPPAYFPDVRFSRPEEFAPALFFTLALAGYLKKGRWREDVFEHWLVLSLIVAAVTQAVFMSQSMDLFDFEFDTAHLLKKVAYLCVLTGLMISMLSIFRQADQGEARFRRAIASIQEGFALYDANDRLVVCNDEYLRLHAGIGNIIKPGMLFEDMARAGAIRGNITEAVGRVEEFVAERLRQHRNPTGPFVRELSDGTWYIISEARTPDGGIAVTETDITELKEAEKALRESEARMRAIIDNVPAMISIKDRESRYLLINQHHREFFSVDQEIIGRTSAVLSSELGRQVREIEKSVINSGEVMPVYDFPWNDGKGNEYDLMVSKAPLKDLSGVTVGTITASIDVTEQKRAERELKQSEKLNRRILEASPVGVIIATRDGEHLFANERALEIQGVTREELFSHSAASYYADPDVRTRLKDDLYRTGATPPTEVELVRPDGSHYFVILSSALTEFEGRAAHLTFMYDVTTLKRTQEALRETEERTSAIVDNVIDGIITIDPRGTILSANQAAERMFGYAENVLTGANVSMLAPEPHRGLHDRYIRSYTTTGEAKILGEVRELEGQRADGTRFPMELAVSALTLGDEQLFVGVCRDITERKAMDRMKGEFVSTVSHELRTPLTSIRGSLGLLAGGAVGAIPDSAREMIEMAEKNTERLINLVNDILDMEKLESGATEFRFAPVDLGALVQASVDANEGYADEYGVTFACTDSSDGAKVRGDADRLTQVMANLLSNAAKFSPEGGTVEISVTTGDGVARVAVADHGPGIAEEFHAQLFSRFTQADSSDTRQAGGTGLGLNISKTIIDKHGGTIGFDTEVGVGTTFYFEVPLTVVTAVVADAVSASVRKGSRILICEDDADVAGLLSLMLEGAGYAADMAYTVAQATQLLSAKRYDAMILDLVLPDQDGISFLRSLRDDDNTRDLPIIVVSVVADERKGELKAGEAVGVIDWLAKPIDQERLLAAVVSALPKGGDGRRKLLYVEDDGDLVAVVSRLLQDVADLVAAATLTEAKTILRKERFDLVVIDLGLPDGSGLDLLGHLRKKGDEATPVIIFSADEVEPEIAAAVNAALVKSQTSNEQLLETIRTFIRPSPA